MERLSEYISFRDVRLALAYSILWFIALGVFGYPENERLGIVIVAYLALWVSRLIVNALLGFAFKRLHIYALSIVGQERLDAIAESEPAMELDSSVRAYFVGLALAIMSTILGLSLVAIPPMVGYMGATSLGLPFTVIAWLTLGVSAVTLSYLVAVPFWGWSRIKAGMREPQQAPIIEIKQSQGYLRRFGFAAAWP